MTVERDRADAVRTVARARTGIDGFDAVSNGGLPAGRVTLVVGGPGAGKTVFALETLVNGASEYGEPAIFVAFEENSRQIVQNARTFGWDLEALERDRLFFLDARLSPSTVVGGEFDLSAMLAGLAAKAREMGARRVVFDGIDVLLTLLGDPAAERREVHRIYEWLQAEGLTGIITAKADEGDRATSDRYAFMQFMVDCVVILHYRLKDRVSLRTLRIQKYRGSAFREGEFPLVISHSGLDVATYGEETLDYPVSEERVSTGVARLDTMLSGGYHRGSGALISGAPGTAKTTLSGAFAAAACERGERALFISFDEAGTQIVRNLRSVGLDLEAYVESGLLRIIGLRTESRGAEEHLVHLKTLLREFEPSVLVLDPISALVKTGGQVAASHAAVRLLDFARGLGVTTVCTSLVSADDVLVEATSMQISTLADTWIHLSYAVHGGERNRLLTVVKSRGTRHSNQVRELILSDEGIELADVYTAGGEVLVGTARWEREAEIREAEAARLESAARRRAEMQVMQSDVEERIRTLQRQLELHRAELQEAAVAESTRVQHRDAVRSERLLRRSADDDTGRRDGARGDGPSRRER